MKPVLLLLEQGAHQPGTRISQFPLEVPDDGHAQPDPPLVVQVNFVLVSRFGLALLSHRVELDVDVVASLIVLLAVLDPKPVIMRSYFTFSLIEINNPAIQPFEGSRTLLGLL